MKRLILTVVALTAACGSSTFFTRTGLDKLPIASTGSCPAAVLERVPIDRKFVEIGFCTTSILGGGLVRDNTPKAIAELQQCACQNGGNAMVFHGDDESGVITGLGYSQQRVRARATVLYVPPIEPGG